jgi:hypothetical protein
VSKTTLHGPHICGACESPLPPYRAVLDGRQCGCEEPSCPKAVPADALYLFALDLDQTVEGLRRTSDEIQAESSSLEDSLDRLQRDRVEAGDLTPAELIAGHVEAARAELLKARKIADRYGEGELHRKGCEISSDVDDFMAMLADRSRS